MNERNNTGQHGGTMPPYQPNPDAQGPYLMSPGNYPPPPKKRGWVPWVAGGGAFFVGMILGYASAEGETTASTSASQPTTTATQTIPGPAVTETTTLPPQPAKTVTQAPPGPAAVMEDDGTYLVGTDVKPGTYRANGGGTCYWARLRNLNGDLDSIITNNLGANPVVTIKKTDRAFETSNCGEWKKIR